MRASASLSHWYVVQCKPREDARALEHLERQGFACFLPALTVEKVRRGRKVEAQEPLFPRYLFVNLDPVNDNWYAIQSTRGVLQMVRFNEYPLPVADGIVEGIRERLAGAGRPRIPYLQPGERVRITEGCFADLDAIFVAHEGAERVVLLMNLLHREQCLSFPVTSVSQVSGLPLPHGPEQ